MRKILLVTFAALIGTSMAVQTNKLSLQKVAKILGNSQIEESTNENPRPPRHFLDTDAPAREELAQYLFAESYKAAKKPASNNGTSTSNSTGNKTNPPQNGSAGGNGTQPPRNDSAGGNGTNPPPQNGSAGNGTQPPRNESSGGNGTQPPRNESSGGNGTQPPRNESCGGNGTQPPRNESAGGNGTQPPRNESSGGNGTQPPRNESAGGNGTQPPRNGSAGGNGTNPPPQNGSQGNGTQPPRNGSQGGNGTNPPPQNETSTSRTSLIQSLLRKKSENQTASSKNETRGPKKEKNETEETEESSEDEDRPPREDEEEDSREVCYDLNETLPSEFYTPNGKLNFNPAFGRVDWTDPIAQKNISGNFSDFVKFISNVTGQDFNGPFKGARKFCELHGFLSHLSEWVGSQPEFDEETNSYKGITVTFDIDTYFEYVQMLLPLPPYEEDEHYE